MSIHNHHIHIQSYDDYRMMIVYNVVGFFVENIWKLTQDILFVMIILCVCYVTMTTWTLKLIFFCQMKFWLLMETVLFWNLRISFLNDSFPAKDCQIQLCVSVCLCVYSLLNWNKISSLMFFFFLELIIFQLFKILNKEKCEFSLLDSWKIMNFLFSS